eukprot:5935535-Prymnesium_polylepis.1
MAHAGCPPSHGASVGDGIGTKIGREGGLLTGCAEGGPAEPNSPAPNMGITFVKSRKVGTLISYLDNYWVTNEKLYGNRSGSSCRAQIR